MRTLLVVPVLLVSWGHAAAESHDWPGLRGPRHDGGAAGTLEATDGATFAVAWRAALGAGYSPPAAAEVAGR